MTTAVHQLQPRPGRRIVLIVVAWLLVGAGVGVVGAAVLAQVAPWPVSALPYYAAPYALLRALIEVSASRARNAAALAAGCFLVVVFRPHLRVVCGRH